MHRIIVITLTRVSIILLLFTGCYTTKHFENEIIKPVLKPIAISERQKEIDNIYSLLTYSVVFKNWQSEKIPRNKRRGYNIAALLVDSNLHPVCAALNSITLLDDATQHGEVRAITGYLKNAGGFNLKGFTVYTTLEPCVMCAGMMTMTTVKRNVYGQHDVEYSKAFERLAIDTRPIGGFKPYPRRVEAEASGSPFCAKLDSAYQIFLETDSEKILAKFLTSEEARKIYQEAYTSFTSFKPSYPENQEIYQLALDFLKNFNNEKTKP